MPADYTLLLISESGRTKQSVCVSVALDVSCVILLLQHSLMTGNYVRYAVSVNLVLKAISAFELLQWLK
jgi:hypothetical protein